METAKQEKLIFPAEQMEYNKEESGFVHPAWVRRVAKDITVTDYDDKENRIEIEHFGDRAWLPLSDLFGIVVTTHKLLYQPYPDREYFYNFFIKNVITYKVKRTLYMALIFDYDLPF